MLEHSPLAGPEFTSAMTYEYLMRRVDQLLPPDNNAPEWVTTKSSAGTRVTRAPQQETIAGQPDITVITIDNPSSRMHVAMQEIQDARLPHRHRIAQVALSIAKPDVSQQHGVGLSLYLYTADQQPEELAVGTLDYVICDYMFNRGGLYRQISPGRHIGRTVMRWLDDYVQVQEQAHPDGTLPFYP